MIGQFMGFIVEVRARGEEPVQYVYGGDSRALMPGEVFIGYFGQMYEKQSDGTFAKACVQEVRLVDEGRKLFRYGMDAVFPAERIVVVIRALRGPDSNNRFLPDRFKNYDTWYAQR